MKQIFLFLAFFVFSTSLFVANSNPHTELEARQYNPETCERMRNNWDTTAKTWCSDIGGVDTNSTTRRCLGDQKSPLFTKVVGCLSIITIKLEFITKTDLP